MKNTDPSLALRLLRAFCPPHLLEEIEGDLLQKFERDLKSPDHSEWSGDYKLRRAKRRLLWNVIRYFRPEILFRNNSTTSINSFAMFFNYFKIAIRIMLRNKSYSMINISGLALGLTGAILLGLWVKMEFSYDQFHKDKERIYMAWNRQTSNGKISCWSTTPRVLAPTLATDFASVETAISFANWQDSYLFSVGDKKLIKNEASFTDSKIFEILSFPLLKGDEKKALASPNSIVLTEHFARELFGDKEAFGEVVTLSQSGVSIPFTVTGILEDLPPNTDFHFEFLLPMLFIESNYGKDTQWSNNSVITLAKIKDGTSVESLNAIIKDLRKKNTNGGNDTELFLYPLTKTHLYSKFENGVLTGGRIEIIRMMIILGVCLVAIACINFINLSTARAARRAKEVAIRKVTGAVRLSLITQFLCESVLVAFGASIFALAASYLLLPFFNSLVHQSMTLNLADISFWPLAIFSVLIVGFLAGGYPAFYISSFQPSRILKGGKISSNSRNVLRSLLVIIQFGFALTLVTSTIVVYQQVVHVQNRETGYDKNNLVYQHLTGDLAKNFEAYKNELISSGVGLSVTRTSSPITQRLSNSSGIQWRGKDPQDKTPIERFYVDESICATAGLQIEKGRDMDLKKFPSDSTAVLLNQAAVKLMGFEEPIGEIIEDNAIEWHVVGVVKDFVLSSPYRKVEPIIMPGSKGGDNGMFGVVHIKFNPSRSTHENVESLSKTATKFNPDYPFEYHFVDAEYARKFADVETTLMITVLFCCIAIFIGCLGLLGLSTFMIEARIKEIGIRKVMGGSIASIVRLLSGHTLRPIFWSIILFGPAGWWAMERWLETYDYRISFSVWILVFAAMMLLSLALLTIITQTFKAANSNPVTSLRSE